jgi:hypothetical protein
MRSTALEAALAELQQWGVDRFALEGVAHRSQLAPEYIRNMWESGYGETMIKVPDSDSLHGDLTELALALGEYLNEPVGRRLARMMVIDSKSLAVDAEIRVQFWLLRRKVIDDIFDRAARRGELRNDVKPLLTLQMLTSPLHTMALYTDLELEPSFCRAVADMVTRAIRSA